MKLIITFLSILFISFLSSPSWSKTLTIDDLVETNGLYYKKFTDVPFTGEITGIESGNFKDGSRDGIWKIYHENGRLGEKGNYKDGKEDGLFEYFNEDGSVGETENYEEGVLVTYYENGHVKTKGNYIFGVKEGRIGNFKDGPWEYFNEDGTVEKTENYKDGKLVD